ncbi:hypothetical protein HQ560_11695, partial [bacterium]|nr:hypothetical protein [bacterium]
MFRVLIPLLTLLTLAPSASAELHVANIFATNMVIQQEKPIRVWGRADAGQVVHVALGSAKAQTTADAKGDWLVTFPARKASFEPIQLTTAAGEKAITYKNILIGEVWLCGGQSNMAPAGHESADLEYPCADAEFVRYTRVESAIATEPAADLRSRENWMPLVNGKMELRRVSPVAYYFGVRLGRFLKVPVGIINTAVGGTTAEVWASRETQAKHPELQGLLAARGKDIGAFYNGAILPLGRLGVRGFLFYQGENNTF